MGTSTSSSRWGRLSQQLSTLTAAIPDRRSFLLLQLYLYLGFVFSVYIWYLHPVNPNGWPLDVSLIKILQSVVFSTVAMLVIPSDQHPFVALSGWLLLIFTIVPVTAYYALTSGPQLFTATVVLAFLIAIEVGKRTPRIIPVLNNPNLNLAGYGAHFVIGSLLILIGIVLLGLFIANGPPRTDPLFYQNTYEIRGELELPFRNFGYLRAWAGNVAIPILAAIYLYRGSYRLFGIVVVTNLLLYMWTPFKLLVALLPFVVGVLWLEYHNKINGGVLAAAVTVMVGIFAIGALTGTTLPRYLVAARMIFWQGRAHFIFFEFFNSNQHVIFTSTPLNPLDYPYSKPVPFVVSEASGLVGEHNMNAGIFADAFAQGGYAGVLIIGAALGFLLAALESLAKVSDYRILLAGVAIPFFNQTQSAFTIGLLTGGFLLVIGIGVLYDS